MRTNSFRSIAVLLIVCLSCCVVPRLFAAQADLLSQAYAALARADHDYKGHRVAAMKHVQAAAKLMGVTIQGEGKGHEKQFVSDEQLRTAQKLLQQARAGLTGKPLKHVNQAIEQISTALAIK